MNSVNQQDNSLLMAPRCSDRSGFNLVEVALAMLVVAIGILSIMAIFPTGLDQNRRSEANVHATLFAQEVFSGLRAIAETNWDTIADATTNKYAISLPPSAPDPTIWYNQPDLRTEIAGNDIQTNIYCCQSDTNIVNHTFRYKLTMTNVTASTSIVSAIVQVWSEEFGSLSNPDEIYYTEFYKLKP